MGAAIFFCPYMFLQLYVEVKINKTCEIISFKQTHNISLSQNYITTILCRTANKKNRSNDHQTTKRCVHVELLNITYLSYEVAQKVKVRYKSMYCTSQCF